MLCCPWRSPRRASNRLPGGARKSSSRPAASINRSFIRARCWIDAGRPRAAWPAKTAAARLSAKLLITDQRNDHQYVPSSGAGVQFICRVRGQPERLRQYCSCVGFANREQLYHQPRSGLGEDRRAYLPLARATFAQRWVKPRLWWRLCESGQSVHYSCAGDWSADRSISFLTALGGGRSGRPLRRLGRRERCVGRRRGCRKCQSWCPSG